MAQTIKRKPETDLTDEIYARTAWTQSNSYEPLNENIFKEANANWERVQRGFEAMRKKYPEKLAEPQCLCQDGGSSE